jgi:hypothetical protein
MNFLFVCLALCQLSPGVAAARLHHQRDSQDRLNRTGLRGASVDTIPMFLYKQDCFKKRPVSKALLQYASAKKTNASLNSSQVPGAGMDLSSILPFQTVLKDGFFHVDCVKDYMYYFGDTHGDHADQYAIQKVSNTSIVLYDVMVPKQDREPMTHDVCFAFCRTVPEMMFFGIANGRSCYCTPYFRAMADDSSQCEAVCEGDKTTTCGGRKKSAIFEMHMCNSVVQDLVEAYENMKDMRANLLKIHVYLDYVAQAIKLYSETVQAKFGKEGDPSAAALAQQGKVAAGKLIETCSDTKTELNRMETMEKKAFEFEKRGAPTGFESQEEFEKLTAEMKEAEIDSDKRATDLSATVLQINPDTLNVSVTVDANHTLEDLYKDAMYFVDKSYEGMPATCSGDLQGVPMFGTLEGCYKACANAPQECVGFTWFDNHLCFTLSKVKAIQYYSGCSDKEMKTFTSLGGATVCKVKFSEFVGTSIAPKADGSCKNCVKEAINAKRCPPRTYR